MANFLQILHTVRPPVPKLELIDSRSIWILNAGVAISTEPTRTDGEDLQRSLDPAEKRCRKTTNQGFVCQGEKQGKMNGAKLIIDKYITIHLPGMIFSFPLDLLEEL